MVANPLQVKAIAHARIKTDKVDAHALAQLLRLDFIPAVEMPDKRTGELRQLVTHRQLLVPGDRRYSRPKLDLGHRHFPLFGPI